MKVVDKIASIVPIAHLKMTKQDKYFMALSHLVNNKEYADFYRDRAASGAHVILDNSVVEQGTPERPEAYLEKALEINASQVVIPDHPLDSVRSLAEVLPFLKIAEAMRYPRAVMAVPHGERMIEYLYCFDRMVEFPVDTIGISRLDYERGTFEGQSRAEVAAMLYQRAGGAEAAPNFHFLGCTNAPVLDIGPALNLRRSQGVDSSLAALCTKHGVRLNATTRRSMDWEPINFENDVYDEKLLQQNLWTWKELLDP